MFLDVRDKSKRRMITAKIRVIRERNRVSSFLGFSLLVQFSLLLLSLVVSLLESSIFSLTSFSFRRLTWNIWLIFQDVLGLLNGQVYKKCISWRHLFYHSVIKERALLCLVSNERLLQISYNMRMWICKLWRMRRIDITSLFYCETRVGCKTLINQTKLIGRGGGEGRRKHGDAEVHIVLQEIYLSAFFSPSEATCTMLLLDSIRAAVINVLGIGYSD